MNRLALIGLVAFAGAAEPGPKGLEAFLDKDLGKSGESGAIDFARRLQEVTGDPAEKDAWSSFAPRWVKPLAKGDVAFVCVTAYPGRAIPDVSGLCIHLFDKDWKRVEKQTFPTGYRFFLTDVKMSEENPMKEKVIVATVNSAGPFVVQENGAKVPAFEQGNSQRQYYALVGKSFALVRLEDNTRRLARNSYAWSAPMKGPGVPNRTREEWIATLSAKEPAVVLATLVWLSGGHLKSAEERKPDHNQESVEDSKRFESVRDAEETKAALNKLKKSENAWIREYVELALQVAAGKGE